MIPDSTAGYSCPPCRSGKSGFSICHVGQIHKAPGDAAAQDLEGPLSLLSVSVQFLFSFYCLFRRGSVHSLLLLLLLSSSLLLLAWTEPSYRIYSLVPPRNTKMAIAARRNVKEIKQKNVSLTNSNKSHTDA